MRPAGECGRLWRGPHLATWAPRILWIGPLPPQTIRHRVVLARRGHEYRTTRLVLGSAESRGVLVPLGISLCPPRLRYTSLLHQVISSAHDPDADLPNRKADGPAATRGERQGSVNRCGDPRGRGSFGAGRSGRPPGPAAASFWACRRLLVGSWRHLRAA